MSEYPEWLEDRIGLNALSYEEGLELHRKVAIVYELIPSIDAIMERARPPSPAAPKGDSRDSPGMVGRNP